MQSAEHRDKACWSYCQSPTKQHKIHPWQSHFTHIQEHKHNQRQNINTLMLHLRRVCKIQYSMWGVMGSAQEMIDVMCGRWEERPGGDWVGQRFWVLETLQSYVLEWLFPVSVQYDFLNSNCSDRTETWSLLHYWHRDDSGVLANKWSMSDSREFLRGVKWIGSFHVMEFRYHSIKY